MANNFERERLRRSLQTSLNSILGDVAFDALQMRSATFAAIPTAVSSADIAPLQLHGNLDLIGIGFPPVKSPIGVMDLLRDHSALLPTIEQTNLLDQARKALLEQSIAQEKSRIFQQGYLALLRNQGVSSKASFTAPQAPVVSAKKTLETLQALGSNLRSRTDPFIDVSSMAEREAHVLPPERRPRGGVAEPFPERLHRVLREVERDGKGDIISFLPHGRAFMVFDHERFQKEIMPQYFKQSKWHSFTRQVNLWGFQRISTGPDAGGYYHELFLKGRPSLCAYMRRVGVPHGQSDRRRNRARTVDASDPDFYSMTPLP